MKATIELIFFQRSESQTLATLFVKKYTLNKIVN